MTKPQPDRQNGDGLQTLADEIEASNGLILMTVLGTTSQLGIKKTAQIIAALRDTPPSGNAGERAGEACPVCADFPPNCWRYDCPKRSAATPPQPAPDALREALRVISTMAICEDGETAEQRALIVEACLDVATHALSTPPAGQISIEQLRVAIADGYNNGNQQYEECDAFARMRFDAAAHAVAALSAPVPSPDPGLDKFKREVAEHYAAEPVAWRWRYKGSDWHTHFQYGPSKPGPLSNLVDVIPLYAAPPVRGDLEALAQPMTQDTTGIIHETSKTTRNS